MLTSSGCYVTITINGTVNKYAQCQAQQRKVIELFSTYLEVDLSEIWDDN